MRKTLITLGVVVVLAGVFLSVAQTSSSLWRMTHQSLVPADGAKVLGLPECPTDLSTVRIGFCYDPATGRIKMRDGLGVRDL